MTDDLIKPTQEWWANRADLMYRHGVERGEDNVKMLVRVVVREYDAGLIDIHKLLVSLRTLSNG